jgi:hypothetical protein
MKYRISVPQELFPVPTNPEEFDMLKHMLSKEIQIRAGMGLSVDFRHLQSSLVAQFYREDQQ